MRAPRSGVVEAELDRAFALHQAGQDEEALAVLRALVGEDAAAHWKHGPGTRGSPGCAPSFRPRPAAFSRSLG